ncbi:MAG: DUF1289 domain-containing protein [Pseudomonadales bacterium]|nr:DUF1289 domain-containing protein [Pseudomonadales bacterium]MDP4876165.1 DUF1289 domain-containing protein [Pseudomonadales bacterium]MDP4912008.1 DUF1289 domain-containing protein [Pseudomonadales bacterium]MDP5058206.1 DUF1289 domain-containing protein [Pseudomonadales bacterium]
MNTSPKNTVNDIPSPCVDICSLDEHDICIGCLRSLDEIGEWGAATKDRRLAIINASRARQAN